MRSLIASTLEELGPAVKITEASSGFEALRLLPRGVFDLIVTDINMPDINGLELVSFVKQEPGLRGDPADHRLDRGLGARPREGPRPRRRRVPGEALRARGAARHSRASCSRRAARRAEPWPRAARAQKRRTQGVPRVRLRGRGDPRADARRPERPGRRAAGSGADVDPELVNRLFRSAHSLKGLAGMFGLDGVSELAHHLEDVLDGLRMGRTAARRPRPRAARRVGRAGGPDPREAARSGESGGLDERRPRELIATHRRLGERAPRGGGAAASATSSTSSPRCCARSPSTRSTACARTCGGAAASIVVEASFDILSFEEGLAELTARGRARSGEVLSTLPSPGESPESQIRFSLLVATELDADGLAARLELRARRGALGSRAARDRAERARASGPPTRRRRRRAAPPRRAPRGEATPTRPPRRGARPAPSSARSSRSARRCASTSASSTS